MEKVEVRKVINKLLEQEYGTNPEITGEKVAYFEDILEDMKEVYNSEVNHEILSLISMILKLKFITDIKYITKNNILELEEFSTNDVLDKFAEEVIKDNNLEIKDIKDWKNNKDIVQKVGEVAFELKSEEVTGDIDSESEIYEFILYNADGEYNQAIIRLIEGY